MEAAIGEDVFVDDRTLISMRTTAVLVLLLTLAAAAGAQTERPDQPQPQEDLGTSVVGDGVIIPGQRIGPLRLGMSIDQILKEMPSGYKREVFDKQNIILYEWRTQGIWVSLDEASKAVRLISAFGSGNYHTDKGVSLLHPESKMVGVYGKEFKRYQYPDDRIALVRYVSLGLQFGLVNQPSNVVLHGRIFTIGVYAPGKEPPLTKKPTQ